MNPLHGRVDTPGSTFYLDMANYSCNVGYQLIGDVLRQCQGSGQWSGEEPTCHSMHAWGRGRLVKKLPFTLFPFIHSC